jgi:hypothetical protein
MRSRTGSWHGRRRERRQAGFFTDLTRAGGERFVADLDYIGLDFFPDVFRPVAADRLADVVEALLAGHRQDNLVPAGLGHLPLVVTEQRPLGRLWLFCRFGLMTDDYTPKPAFHVFRDLIARY